MKVKINSPTKYKYLIVGPSGSGKTTLEEGLKQTFRFKSVKSYTTRPKRSENDNSHTFITVNEFKTRESNSEFVAKTFFDGNYYGATIEQIQNADLYTIDIAGVYRLISKDPLFYEKYKLILLESSLPVRIYRMRKRGDNDSAIIDRIINDDTAFNEHNIDFLKEQFNYAEPIHGLGNNMEIICTDYVEENMVLTNAINFIVHWENQNE